MALTDKHTNIPDQLVDHMTYWKSYDQYVITPQNDNFVIPTATPSTINPAL